MEASEEKLENIEREAKSSKVKGFSSNTSRESDEKCCGIDVAGFQVLKTA